MALYDEFVKEMKKKSGKNETEEISILELMKKLQKFLDTKKEKKRRDLADYY